MDEEQHDKIRRHMPHLLYTDCSLQFLAYFQKNNIFSFEELTGIDSIKNPVGRATEFYRLIQKRINWYGVLLEALRATGQNNIVTILDEGIVPESICERVQTEKYVQERIAGSSHSRQFKRNIKFNVTAPVTMFTGRENELEDLHSKVLSGGNATVVTQTQFLSISGLGGIGKTQLTRMYIQKYTKEFDENVLWFTAEDEEELAEEVKQVCADKLRIPLKTPDGAMKKLSSIVADMYTFFEGVKCLIVFDNADKSPWLPKYLPKGPTTQKPYVIITSRNREWGPDVEVVNLSELKLEEAVRMVKQGLKMQDSSEDAKIEEICNLLQCFPLALGQAVSYISEKRLTSDYTIQNYLNDYEKESKQLLAFQSQNREFADKYTKSTYNTWKLTREQISTDEQFGKVAIQVLEWMAYFNPDNISRSIFLHSTINDACSDETGEADLNQSRGYCVSKFMRCLCCTAKNQYQPMVHPMTILISDELLIGAVRLLVRYSLVNGNENQSILSIHRLVQQVIRMELEGGQREEAVLGKVLPHLKQVIFDEESAVSQAISSWRYAYKYDGLLKKYCQHLITMTNIMDSKGRYQEVISFVKLALEHLNRLKHTENDSEIKETMFWLRLKNGGSLIRLGYPDEARELMEALVDETSKTYGVHHEFTFTAMNSLASVLSELGQINESIEIQRMLCESSKKASIEASRIIIYKRNLATNLIKVGNYVEARELLSEILSSESVLKSRGDNLMTQYYLSAQLSLGNVHFYEGNYNYSTAVLTGAIETNKLLKIYQEVVLTMDLHRLLGRDLSLVGKVDEGLNLLQEALRLYYQVHGKNHWKSLQTLCYLGRIHGRMGNTEEALKRHEEALKRSLETNGGKERHEVVQLARQCIAEDKLSLGQHDEAIRIFEQVSKTLTDNWLDPKDYFVIECEINFARALVEQGNKEKAKELLLHLKTKLNGEETDRMSLVNELFTNVDPAFPPEIFASIASLEKFP